MGVVGLLEELGHEVVEAPNGRQALERLKVDQTIELLLTDFRMPGLSGLDLITQCREINPTIKIVLMTGYSSEDHIFPDDCPVRLYKPFGMQHLVQAMDQVLQIS